MGRYLPFYVLLLHSIKEMQFRKENFIFILRHNLGILEGRIEDELFWATGPIMVISSETMQKEQENSHMLY